MGSEPEEQGDLAGTEEAGSAEEESESEYSAAEEDILTKAGVCRGGSGVPCAPWPSSAALRSSVQNVLLS